MEKIKNICRDLGRAFTIGLLSGGAAAAVLLLGRSSSLGDSRSALPLRRRKTACC